MSSVKHISWPLSLLRCGDRDSQPSPLPPRRPVDQSMAALSAEDAAPLSEEQNTRITTAEIEQIRAESKSGGGKKMRGGSSRDDLEQRGRCKKLDKKGVETTESTENLELMKEKARI